MKIPVNNGRTQTKAEINKKIMHLTTQTGKTNT